MQNILTLETTKYAIKLQNFEGPLDLLYAFVELFSGIEGLVHISEITDDNIAKPSEKLEIN